MAKLAFIWAENAYGYIGKKGKLPWSLPADLNYFKEVTLGHPVVMGRKTFDSLHVKPLPKRKNIVLTNNQDFNYQDVTVVHSLTELKNLVQSLPDEIVFVIGGAKLFTLLLPDVDMLYKTTIEEDSTGDVMMPEIDYSQFRLKKVMDGVVDEQNKYPHIFEIYQKKALN